MDKTYKTNKENHTNNLNNNNTINSNSNSNSNTNTSASPSTTPSSTFSKVGGWFKKVGALVVSLIVSFPWIGAKAQGNQLTGDHRELSIYQIMVASFQHSDNTDAPGYSAMWGPDDARKNGNLKGVTEALDYIKGLGVNAIWLTPVFDSSDSFGGEKLQATGYFCSDFFKIDPHFGTEAEFKELVDEAHKRDMYVILDGVFGHRGIEDEMAPSPQGNRLYGSMGQVKDGRGDMSGNIKYPESLPYMKELVRYWMENYDVDGWRLDQSYQVVQNGHNYWKDIREEVEKVAQENRDKGRRWGTLGYMVGEDWGSPDVIVTTSLDGLRSVFDFDGMENVISMPDGLQTIQKIYSTPVERGYENNLIMPNLFMSNHDVSRPGDFFDDLDEIKLRYAILAGYTGPVTLYYGDEFGDKSGDSQPDNKARTTGHLEAQNAQQQSLHDYVAALFKARGENPSMWRGNNSYRQSENGNTLEVTKTDPESDNQVIMVYSIEDAQWELPVEEVEGVELVDLISGESVGKKINVKGMIPSVIKVK